MLVCFDISIVNNCVLFYFHDYAVKDDKSKPLKVVAYSICHQGRSQKFVFFLGGIKFLGRYKT